MRCSQSTRRSFCVHCWCFKSHVKPCGQQCMSSEQQTAYKNVKKLECNLNKMLFFNKFSDLCRSWRQIYCKLLLDWAVLNREAYFVMTYIWKWTATIFSSCLLAASTFRWATALFIWTDSVDITISASSKAHDENACCGWKHLKFKTLQQCYFENDLKVMRSTGWKCLLI